MKKYELPTGFLFVDDYSKGELETLSIGDYGKSKNIKADFLGHSRELAGVENGAIMPLQEKWVITLSTQYGCAMKCDFCLTPYSPILMSDYTTKPINDIEIGDVVIANMDLKENSSNRSNLYASKSTKTAKVTGLHKRVYDGSIYVITTESGNCISCTKEHPIASEYKSRIKFKDARDLHIGDMILASRDINPDLHSFSFLEKIVKIETYDYNGLVYNIETSEHTYFSNGILSHNCDVPKVKFKGNASFEDLKQQLYSAIKMFPDVHYTDRLNIHYARMGDPIFNEDVLGFTEWLMFSKRQIQDETGLRVEVIHPVFTTMCPTYKNTRRMLHDYVYLKNEVFNGQAGLQLSINSTSNDQRDDMFNNMNMSLEEISEMVSNFPTPIGRKYCLNIAYASGNEANGEYLASLFSPDDWMVKITPIHNNNACMENGIETVNGYDSYAPYKDAEQSFIKAGFDTLVFIPSLDEENGLITCGNAVLGGSEFKLDVK